MCTSRNVVYFPPNVMFTFSLQSSDNGTRHPQKLTDKSDGLDEFGWLLPGCHSSSLGYLFGSRFVSDAWMNPRSDERKPARQMEPSTDQRAQLARR